MRTCVDNIVELRRTSDSVRDITADTINIFQQLNTIATANDPGSSWVCRLILLVFHNHYICLMY